MDGQVNYIGAAIFWPYILAAFFFSALVIHTIVTLPRLSDTNQQLREKDVTLFSALTCVSFATLSYNMLNVLIESFNSWSRENDMSASSNLAYSIWKWSITSTLFLDFAEAIVKDGARYLWIQGALFATLSVCFYMAAEGTFGS